MRLQTKIGIIGGGQLGQMLIQSAVNFGVECAVLSANSQSPATKICGMTQTGDITDYDTVLRFGRTADVVTVEIEHVNTDALEKLESEGKPVIPSAAVIRTIQDKGAQKTCYQTHQIPTAPFELIQTKEDLRRLVKEGKLKFPLIQKSRRNGYDGRGVQLLKTEANLASAWDTPSVIETAVDIEKEIGVIVVRNPKGDIQIYPPVEMVFHPQSHLLQYLISPARISDAEARSCIAAARKVSEALRSAGCLAVELFLTKTGEVLVNESAPRPHNSGHHTIEGNVTSQYENLMRVLLDLPLGDTAIRKPAVMVNLLGASDTSKGPARYHHLDLPLSWPETHLHLYGKTEVSPHRKMGHVTILDTDLDQALARADQILKKVTIST